jgi:hypothetical protein
MLRVKPRHPVLLKPALPSRNRWSRSLQLDFDLTPAFAFG